MKKRYPAKLLLTIVLLSGSVSCVMAQQYLSPIHLHSNPYYTIPLKSDSFQTATYISAVYSAGFSNEFADSLFDWRLEIYRSKNFGSFQAYYGAHLEFGKYNVSGLFGQSFYPFSLAKVPTGQYFFGNIGFNGGINFVLPFEHWEWRPFGLETSVQKEFGDYLSFRKKLPDSVASFIFRKTVTATLGLYTEFAGIRKQGTTYGFKIGYGIMLNPIRDFSNPYGTGYFPLIYLSISSHVTKGRFTGYCQLNLGDYGFNGQFGVNYRL